MLVSKSKKYIRQEVLGVATQVFLRLGYGGASVETLVEATGVHRRSMYGEFGDKDGLFLACIDHYANYTARHLFEILKSSPGGLQAIGEFFRERVDFSANESSQGCLFVNTIIEGSLVAPEALAKANMYLRILEDEFYVCLTVAQARGHISQDKDCRTLSLYLGCLLCGLMVKGKSIQDRDSLDRFVQVALEPLTA